MAARALVLFLIMTASPLQVFGQETSAALPLTSSDNTLGVNVMGGAGFLRLNVGSFELHYERVLSGRHGLRVAADLIHVHQDSAHQQAHQWTFGGSLTYRHYFGALTQPFLGLQVGYRRGFGKVGEEGSENFTRLSNEQLRVLAQGGVKLSFPEHGLSVITAMAVGYGPYSVETTERDDEVGAAAAQLAEDILGATPVALEFEVSLGYAF